MNIGELIIEYCEAHGITQSQFARQIGKTKGYISMLVNNRNPKTGKPIEPGIKTYSAISRDVE